MRMWVSGMLYQCVVCVYVGEWDVAGGYVGE